MSAALALLGLLAASAAGSIVARRLLGPCLGRGDLPLAGAVTGLTIFAAAATIAWRLGAPSAPWGAAALAAAAVAAAACGRGPAFARPVRGDVARWSLWIAVAAVFCGCLHARQVAGGDAGAILRGTLGRETAVHVSVSDAISRGSTEWAAFHEGTIRYHVFTHAVASALERAAGADPYLLWSLVLPPFLLVVAMEAHAYLLRAWFDDGAAVRFAAVLPLLVTDFDAALRALGIAPIPDVDNRIAHSFAVSPSFVAGQAVACFALGATLRLAAAGGPHRLADGAVGVLAGCVVGWKLPSAGVLGVSLAALAIVHRGPRVTCGAAAVACAVAFAASFGPGPVSDGGGTAGMAMTMPGAALSACPWPAALAAMFVPAQILGARMFALREVLARLRTDRRWLAVLVPAAVAVVVPFAVTVGGARHEEKYLVRAGAAPLLLVTGALAWTWAAGRRRALGIAALATLAVTSAWQFRQFATTPRDELRVQSAR